MIKGLGRRIAAAAAVAAAGAVTVIAAAYALYALLKPHIGEAGAAAVVAAVFAVAAWVFAAIVRGKADPDAQGGKAPARREPESPVEALQERFGELVKQRPLMAAGAALAGAFIIVRNPALATILAATLGRRSGPGRR